MASSIDLSRVNWTVRSIVGRRRYHGRIQYLVDWSPEEFSVEEAAIFLSDCSIRGKTIIDFVDLIEHREDIQTVMIFWKDSWEPRQALSCPKLLEKYRRSRRTLRARRDRVDNAHVIDLTQASPEAPNRDEGFVEDRTRHRS